MSFFKTCPHCGAHLDPGERCDCQEFFEIVEALAPEDRAELLQYARARHKFAQLTPENQERVNAKIQDLLQTQKGAARDGANTPDGMAEQINKAVSASSLT